MKERLQVAARWLCLLRHAPGETEEYGSVFASVYAVARANIDMCGWFAAVREFLAKGRDNLCSAGGATTGPAIGSRLDAYEEP